MRAALFIGSYADFSAAPMPKALLPVESNGT